MPIDDPGNAGTAGSRDDWPEPSLIEPEPTPRRQRVANEDARRRAMALCTALVSAVVLLPAVVAVTITGEWRWLLGGLGAWLTLSIVASGVTTYLFGRRG